MAENNICLREFRPSDLKLLRSLIHRTIDISYSEVYPKEAIEFFKDYHSGDNILKDASEGYTIVLELDGRIIGTGTLLGSNVRRVFVDLPFQNQGFGKMIMKALEEEACSNGIEVIDLSASLVSRKFYDSLSYTKLKESFIPVENGQRLDYFEMAKKL